MLGWIKEYQRKKLLKNCRREIATYFINLSNITSLGFIFAITSQESLSDLMDIYRYLKFKGIPFRGLVVETQKSLSIGEEIANAAEITAVAYDRLSWVGAVEGADVEEFFSKTPDLFISFNSNGNFTLDHIFAAYVKSPMRVGMENNPDMPYTLVFEGKEKSLLNPLDYLNQIFHYLNIIKTK